MNLKDLSKYPKIFLKTAGTFMEKNSPTILTGLGVAGTVSTAVMAAKATPKAMDLLLYAKNKKYETQLAEFRENPNHQHLEPVIDNNLTILETIGAVLPAYGPSLIMGTATIGCILGANYLNTKKMAALASLYSLSEATLRDYQAKTRELIGEKKAQAITDEVAGEALNRAPWEDGKAIQTGKGSTLFFDPYSGRYFYNDYQVLRAAQNDVNALIIGDFCASLNDFYDRIGLDTTIQGDEVGWNMENMCELTFSAKLTSKGDPCAVIGFQRGPIYGYRDI